MIANLLRLLFGVAMLPLCWGMARSLFDSFLAGASGWCSVEGMSLLGGMAAFAFCWAAISRPMRAYVFGHELTHALWGLCFGARPSDLRVSESGGSVRLTKSNVFITLAPYFFPFYTFVVIVVALMTYAFMRPLPFLPLWMFLIGFTWAFHVLFTFQTLSQRQPDIKLYGRVFSWTLIFIANVVLVLVWIGAMTELTFAELGRIVAGRCIESYVGLFHWTVWLFSKVKGNG